MSLFSRRSSASRPLPHSAGGTVPRLRRALPPAVLLSTLIFPGPEPVWAGQRNIPLLSSGFHGGMEVRILPNGNIVVLDPNCSPPSAVGAGAVYLFDGATLQPLGVLTGVRQDDHVGSKGIVVLPNGSFLIRSPQWDNGAAADAGAVTWCSGTGVLPSKIAADNSLVGGSGGGLAGNTDIVVLKNGNYVVSSYGGFAVTWGSAETGVAGVVSPANSLVGGSPEGQGVTVTPLSNGNYVVGSHAWNNGGVRRAGAVTWCSGTRGLTGLVSAANSLVGGTETDLVGRTVIPLTNGNYVVASPAWDNGAVPDAGAVTWCDGTQGRMGPVSAENSLVGGTANDLVGSEDEPVVPLNNGHYVVLSPAWNGSRGAATWGNGTTGITGEVSALNSLVGVFPQDIVGSHGAVALADGNYLVRSPYYGGGMVSGAVTWGSGTAGVTGEVSALNSLLGSDGQGQSWGGTGQQIVPLGDRHCLLVNTNWNERRGAVTWCDTATGIRGMVSADNSLVGGSPEDAVGSGGVTLLANGNYVVNSPYWDGHSSAVTWGSAVKGVAGAVSPSNSLVGPRPAAGSLDFTQGSSVVPLTNGNYVVVNPHTGTATWGSGMEKLAGGTGPENSLMGVGAGDGRRTVAAVALSNGHYVVDSSAWGGERGAVTWCDGTRGRAGQVTELNSLTDTASGRNFGPGNFRPLPLPNGNYLVVNPGWNESHGAVTWVDGAVGITGPVSQENSLTGSHRDDMLGWIGAPGSQPGVTLLTNGNYVVTSPWWGGGRGAVTWVTGTTGIRGEVTEENSLTGTGIPRSPQPLKVSALSDGNYLVDGTASSYYGNRFILADGWSGTRGTVTDANSIIPFESVAAWSSPAYWFQYYDAANSRLMVWHNRTAQLSFLGYVPEMAVRTGTGTVPILCGQSVPEVGNGTDFGAAVAAQGSVERAFTILNSGMEPLHLTGTSPVAVEGPDAADFTVTVMPATSTVAATDTAEFHITFAPSTPGLRKAVVRIANDDSNENPYTFAVQGLGLDSSGGGAVIATWRAQFFGNAPEGTGNLDDFDSDGVVNLAEFAFGTHPAGGGSGAGGLRYSGSLAEGGGTLVSTGQPVVVSAGDGTFTALFIRRNDRVPAGLGYTPQFSADLTNWTTATAAPKVLADDGQYQAVALPCPAPVSAAPCFFRVRLDLTQL